MDDDLATFDAFNGIPVNFVQFVARWDQGRQIV